MLKYLWSEIKRLWFDEGGQLEAILPAIPEIFDFLSGSARKERNLQRETEYQNILTQLGISRAQDVLEATTKGRARDIIEGIPEYTPYEYTAPDEEVYRRMTELGIESLQEQGRYAQQAQAEQLAGRGLGASSIGIGAQQRLQERTLRGIGGLEAQYAQQAAQRQMQYEQLMASEQQKAYNAQVERAKLFAEYQGQTPEEVKAEYEALDIPKPEEEYGFWAKLLPGGKAKGEGFFQDIFGKKENRKKGFIGLL